MPSPSFADPVEQSTAPPPVDVVTLGETMALAASTDAAGLALASTLTLTSAGAESNVAIGMSRLGHRVAWVGRVGSDVLGDRVLRDLRAESVVTLATREEDTNTGLMVKESRGPRGTQVLYYRRGSAGSRLGPEDVPEQLIQLASVLHVSGVTPALSPSARAAVEKAVEVAREGGTLVSFDVNYRSRLWPTAEAETALRVILEQCDVLFAGAEEARLFCPPNTAEEDLPTVLSGYGPKEVLLKLGARGAAACVDGAPYVVAPHPVTVVDPVGAGDAFVAGYLSARLRGASVQERLRLAAYVGACACTTGGDWDGFPFSHELATWPEDVRR